MEIGQTVAKVKRLYFILACITALTSIIYTCSSFLYLFFSVLLLLVPCGHSLFFIPATTTNYLLLRWISIPDLIHYILILS